MDESSLLITSNGVTTGLGTCIGRILVSGVMSSILWIFEWRLVMYGFLLFNGGGLENECMFVFLVHDMVKRHDSLIFSVLGLAIKEDVD